MIGAIKEPTPQVGIRSDRAALRAGGAREIVFQSVLTIGTISYESRHQALSRQPTR
jgi:hypothetical protein